MSCPGDLYVVPGANTCGGGGGGSGVTSLQGITGAVNLTSTDSSIQYSIGGNNLNIEKSLFIAQYYKSTSQILASGSIAITYDSTQTWNNPNGFITHNGFGADFVVVRTGIYQVEFALTVTANSTNWNTVRTASINIVRGAINNAVLSQGSHPPTNTDYTQQVVGTLYLLAGDIVRCVHTGVNQNGNGVAAIVLLNTFDYNTTFTWTLLK